MFTLNFIHLVVSNHWNRCPVIAKLHVYNLLIKISFTKSIHVHLHLKNIKSKLMNWKKNCNILHTKCSHNLFWGEQLFVPLVCTFPTKRYCSPLLITWWFRLLVMTRGSWHFWCNFWQCYSMWEPECIFGCRATALSSCTVVHSDSLNKIILKSCCNISWNLLLKWKTYFVYI